MSAAPATTPSRLPAWLMVSLCSGVVMLVWFLCFRFPMTWVITGVGEPNRPFLDLYALLSWRDAARMGIDPYQLNSLDVYHRPLLYSSWWVAFPSLGLGRKDTLWLGCALAVAFLALSIGWLKPRSWRDGVVALATLLSPAFLMAVNRANNDFVVFVTISLGLICFRRPQFGWRLLGISAFALAAVLKYYPLVTVVLLLQFRSRAQRAIGVAVYAAILLVAWPGLAAGLTSAGKNTPAPEWLYAFGAPTLWRNFGSTSQVGWIVLSAIVTAAAAIAAMRDVRLVSAETAEMDAPEREFFCGALIIVGVFFLGASYAYKLIFAIWMVPWLRSPLSELTEERWRKATWWLLLATLWVEGLMAIGINLWMHQFPSAATGVLTVTLVVQQLVEWALIGCLLRAIFLQFWYYGREWRPQPAVPV